MHSVLENSLVTSIRRAFSLVEVVVALGIFAIAIVGVLGLLSPTAGLINETIDSGVASRLADTVNTEIGRLGYAAIVPAALVRSGDVDSLAKTDARLLFGNRAGDKLCNASTAPSAANYVAPVDRFFEVMLVRNESLSPVANDGTAGFAAFAVRVSWPAQIDDGTGASVTVPRTERSVFTFYAAVRR